MMNLLYAAILKIVFTSLVVCGASSLPQKKTLTAEERIELAKRALEYVRSIETAGTCTGGTEEKLVLDFDHNSWSQYTDPAIRTANFLTKVLAIDGNLNTLSQSLFYSLVRNNVHGNTIIFGSAIALEPGLWNDKPLFCPYAFKKNGSVYAIDIANSYDYRQNSTDWYHHVRYSNLENVTIAEDHVDDSGRDVIYEQPVAKYEDGWWTYPYYDCGGGNIWMTTYSAPIMSLNDAKDEAIFKGVATIDIELTNLDINQCDRDPDSQALALDVFRGTHNCQKTTQCQPLKEGFKSGAYLCVCNDGYYFPNASDPLSAFRGSDIDTFFEGLNSSSDPGLTAQFQCLACARGCDTCVDNKPCLYQINTIIQAFVMFVLSVMILTILLVSVLIFNNKNELVFKTASPIFLQLMCLGAVFMCSSVYVLHGEVTDMACKIAIWPYNIGFTLMYVALLLKTWRISLIFKQGGAIKRVQLPDKALLQRLAPFMALTLVYLIIWTVIAPPATEVVETSGDNLKFFMCKKDAWNYSLIGARAFLLLCGVYLCFTVRKVPAHFNESKYITWATYNAIILGSFILMMIEFIGKTTGPDVVFILLMAEQQVFVSITLSLIFAPKFWALYKGTEPSLDHGNSPQIVTITGRVKPLGPASSIGYSSNRYSGRSRSNSGVTSLTFKSSATQCNSEDFYLTSGPIAYQEYENSRRIQSLSPNPLSRYSAKVSPSTSPRLDEGNSLKVPQDSRRKSSEV